MLKRLYQGQTTQKRGLWMGGWLAMIPANCILIIFLHSGERFLRKFTKDRFIYSPYTETIG